MVGSAAGGSANTYNVALTSPSASVSLLTNLTGAVWQNARNVVRAGDYIYYQSALKSGTCTYTEYNVTDGTSVSLTVTQSGIGQYPQHVITDNRVLYFSGSYDFADYLITWKLDFANATVAEVDKVDAYYSVGGFTHQLNNPYHSSYFASSGGDEKIISIGEYTKQKDDPDYDLYYGFYVYIYNITDDTSNIILHLESLGTTVYHTYLQEFPQIDNYKLIALAPEQPGTSDVYYQILDCDAESLTETNHISTTSDTIAHHAARYAVPDILNDKMYTMIWDFEGSTHAEIIEVNPSAGTIVKKVTLVTNDTIFFVSPIGVYYRENDDSTIRKLGSALQIAQPKYNNGYDVFDKTFIDENNLYWFFDDTGATNAVRSYNLDTGEYVSYEAASIATASTAEVVNIGDKLIVRSTNGTNTKTYLVQ